MRNMFREKGKNFPALLTPEDKIKSLMVKRGERLKQWRLVCGYTRANLSAFTGFHFNTIRAWEMGGRIPNEALQALIGKGWPEKQALIGMEINDK